MLLKPIQNVIQEERVKNMTIEGLRKAVVLPLELVVMLATSQWRRHFLFAIFATKQVMILNLASRSSVTWMVAERNKNGSCANTRNNFNIKGRGCDLANKNSGGG